MLLETAVLYSTKVNNTANAPVVTTSVASATEDAIPQLL